MPCLQLNLKLSDNGHMQSIPISLTEEKMNILLNGIFDKYNLIRNELNF